MYTSTEISQKYYTIIKAFVNKQIQNKEDRDDIVQNVFMKIHEKINTIKDEEKIKSWVYKTAQNSIFDYYRSKNNITNIDFENFENNDFKEIDNPIKPMEACLNPFINKLPLIYKQAIELSEIQGLKLQTIADQLNTSLSTIKSRVQRAKTLIKKSYIDCCSFSIDEHGHLKGEHKDPSTCTKCNSN